jgi:hypothetical protein
MGVKWSKDEDRHLGNTVMQYIANGRTQMSAFIDLSAQLRRTREAVAFRWNGTVRHTEPYVTLIKEYRDVINQNRGRYPRAKKTENRHSRGHIEDTQVVRCCTCRAIHEVGESTYFKLEGHLFIGEQGKITEDEVSIFCKLCLRDFIV